jgi:hypothetical protein
LEKRPDRWNSHQLNSFNFLTDTKGKEWTMKSSMSSVLLVAAVLAGSTAVASAQGGSTDSRGNAMGSEHVGNGATSKTGGAMHQSAPGTTGSSLGRSGQDSPNGSPNTPPTSKHGPGGDASKNNDAPK